MFVFDVFVDWSINPVTFQHVLVQQSLLCVFPYVDLCRNKHIFPPDSEIQRQRDAHPLLPAAESHRHNRK